MAERLDISFPKSELWLKKEIQSIPDYSRFVREAVKEKLHGDPVAKRLAAIEKMLQNGVVAVTPKATDEDRDFLNSIKGL
jgi:hypothetical protein